ncbi:MAG: glycosyltransferase family 2 protein [Pseudomonadota bacterium]
MTPEISVVIPAFNALRLLPETLNALKAQTFQNWEAVIVDDGSSDGTAAWLRAEARIDPRIHPIISENGGPSRARDKGVAYSSAPLIAFLDADDIWHDNRLTRLVETFEARPETSVLYSRVSFFRNDPGRPRAVSGILPRPATVEDLLRANPTCTMSNVAVRKEDFLNSGGFDPMIVYGEDREWLVRMAASGARIEGLNEILAQYRLVDGGLSTNLEGMREGWRASLATAQRLGVAPPEWKVEQAEADHLRYLARRALRLNAPPRVAARYALESFIHAPLMALSNLRRVGLVLFAAMAAPLIPGRVRRALFTGA